MKKVVIGSIPGRGCTDLYCASGDQGVLLCKRWWETARQLDLPRLRRHFSELVVVDCN